MPIDPTPSNAAHLLRRAAFGGTPEEIARVAADGIEASVERLLDPAGAPPLTEPHHHPGEQAYHEGQLGAWWMHFCATSATPAIERLCWFWQGHFATSNNKVFYTDLLHRQFATLRHRGLGRFDDLLHLIVHDAAMNIFLDLDQSVVGSPNENFAREIMELFSMGAGRGYVQSDVVEAARAFTGYGLVRDTRIERPIGTKVSPLRHDRGTKTIFGRTGTFDGDDVVDMICATDACHRFVPERLWFRYAGTDIPADVHDELAAVFAADLRIDRLLTAMLTHPRFYDDDVKGGLVADPVSLAVRFARGFAIPFVDPTLPFEEIDRAVDRDGGRHPEMLVEIAAQLGQRVGMPPNVGGWGHNIDWLDSNKAAARLLVATRLGEELAVGGFGDVADLVGSAGNPHALSVALLGRFGVVDVSDETVAAVGAAVTDTDEPESALAAAFAVVFTSPEVTLA